jgi:hypothetical protein
LPIEQYLKLLFVIASESKAIQFFSATNLVCFVAYAPRNDEIPEWYWRKNLTQSPECA